MRNPSYVDMVQNSTPTIDLNEICETTIDLLKTETNVIPEFLIITNNKDINGNILEPYEGKTMVDIFEEFAQYKTLKGIPSVVVTVDTICTRYLGNDIQAKIHNFLLDVYRQYGSIYVLLGGDVNVIPERMVDTMYKNGIGSTTTFLPFPSDLYYSAVQTSWDSNMNGIYGELSDINNHFPDFFLSRAPVENTQEASIFINKCDLYENLSELVEEDRSFVTNLVSMNYHKLNNL